MISGKTKFIYIFSLCLISFSCRGNTALIKNANAGVFIKRQLSYYCPALKKSHGDTAVYVLDSGKPGARMLLIGGTHGNEIAGIRAAELFAKYANIESGTVIVIPALNKSGVLAGSRLVQKKHQGGIDPEKYSPPGGTSEYPGIEQRNINRSYPGSENSGLAQKVAYAVMRLLVSENIDIAIDLHEAAPGSDLAWNIVSNPKNVHIAALAVIDLAETDILMHLDSSPADMEGLSHKEWGDRTKAMSFLIETVNPAQGLNPSLELQNDPQYALERRAAIHLETVRFLVSLCNEELGAPLFYSGIPRYSRQYQ